MSYYQNNKERLDIKHKEYVNREDIKIKIKEYQRNYSRKYRVENREKFLRILGLSARKQRYKHKNFLFELLGNKCSNPKCLVPNGCDDIRCLQLDHINGGGTKEYKKFKVVNSLYYYYFKHPEEAKEKLQILCANCNWIKRHEKNEIKHKY